MKVPFSYRSPVFKPFLAASLMGHMVFLSATTLLPSGARFGVQHGPSSVEVLLVEEPEKRPAERDQILAVEDSMAQAARHPRQAPRPRVQQTAASSERQGAREDDRVDFLKNPAPVYPELAREQGWEGVVILKALVTREGSAAQVDVLRSSGYGVLDEAAVAAVRSWRFTPARVGPVVFSSWVTIPIRFILEEAS